MSHSEAHRPARWAAELLAPEAAPTWTALGAYLRDPGRWSPAVARVLA